MQKLKNILLYILGLTGLVVITILLTGHIEVDIVELPPTATPVRPPTPSPTPQPACLTTPSGLTHAYRPDAPFTSILAPAGLPGQRLVISGTVYAADCVTPLPDVLLEVWQPDANGRYDDIAPYILRGKLQTDARGRYSFTTIKPGYTHTNYVTLPPFIHFRVSYQEELVLSTHIFFAGDYFLNEYWSGLPELVIPLSRQGTTLHGTFDLALPFEAE